MFTPRLIPVMLSALLLASCGGAPTESAPPTGDTPPDGVMAQLLKDLNAARGKAQQCGTQRFPAASPVTWNTQLTAAAHAHALDMANRNYFDHVSPEGGLMEQRVEAAGYVNWRELGENIAAGYTASTVMQGWLDSEKHCATLMDPLLREVGISVVETVSPGNKYANYWVQDFGTR
ncbi:CAP domain-containing protein [Deinococcus koreensis]|uniref:CAP domain-containing protein n=1 Tax=Deinococcus koreensis TaxID=2054903 RepID=A0A2K3UW78_9DEIO|nr:CAP domain-containing protein [Deinococcus koreensis]PNY80770.1 CAP domain-containing protein [Deinococcus koreensis]